MEREVLLLGTMIALLRRQFPGVGIENQIIEGIRIAKKIGIDSAIARAAGDEPTSEEAIVQIDKVATDGAGNYVEVCSWTVTKEKTGVLAKVEMASDDYDNVQWRITIADKVVFADEELPSATTITLPNLSISGDKITKIEAKDTDATAHSIWGDITGKEVV